MKKLRPQESAQASNIIQFTLAGLICFSLALMAGASLITYKVAGNRSPAHQFSVESKDQTSTARTGPWGTLLTRDIELERPAEYLTDEVATPQPEVWKFSGLTSEAVKKVLVKSGLADDQIAAAFAPGTVSENNSGTELLPSEHLLLSLSPEQRQKLFTSLAGSGVNLYIDFPYIFPAADFEGVCTDSRLNPEDVALLKKLIYLNGAARQFSDYPFLMKKIPTLERRTKMTQAMSRQSAVLARIAVRPGTDIDKIASY